MIMNYYVPPFDARFSYNLTCLMTRLDGLLVAMTCCRCCLFKNNANLCTWNKKNTYTSYIHQPSSSLQKHIWFQLNEKKSYKYLEWNKIQKKKQDIDVYYFQYQLIHWHVDDKQDAMLMTSSIIWDVCIRFVYHKMFAIFSSFLHSLV